MTTTTTHATHAGDAGRPGDAPPAAPAPLRIGIVLGTTRPGRRSAPIADWVAAHAATRASAAGAGDGPAATYELVDIAEAGLPLLDEPLPPIMGQYEHAHTKAWSARVAELDAFLFVVPEYNRSIPAALKNAIDFLYHEWHDKAAGFVGYGVDAGGARAIEHLRTVLAEVHVAGVRSVVTLAMGQDFDDEGTFTPQPRRQAELHTVLDQLERWGGAMQSLRAAEHEAPVAA